MLQPFNVHICTQFGMTECFAALGCSLENIDDDGVPMGFPLLGYRCLLIDEHGQLICSANNSSEIGQLHIGGQESLFRLLFEIAFLIFV